MNTNTIIYAATKLPVVMVLIFSAAMLLVNSFLPFAYISLPAPVWVGFTFVILAVLLVLAGGIAFRQASTTVNPIHPEQASSLVCKGVYRLSRNPMYVGFLFCLIALVYYIGNLANLTLIPAFIFCMNKRYIEREEQVMQNKFGNDYLNYKAKVRRWL